MASPLDDKVIRTLIVLDFETGGTNPREDAVTEVSMHAMRLDTLEVFATYQAYIYPYRKKDAIVKKVVRKRKIDQDEEPPLMGYDWDMMKRVTGITQDTLERDGKPIENVVAEMCEFIKGAYLSKGKSSAPTLCGQNIIFDKSFLHQMFAYCGVPLKGLFAGQEGFHCFEIATLDTIEVAKLYFANDLTFQSYKLGAIADKLNIDLCDAHSAEADVEATEEIIRHAAHRLRNGSAAGDIEVAKKIKTREHFRLM